MLLQHMQPDENAKMSWFHFLYVHSRADFYSKRWKHPW